MKKEILGSMLALTAGMASQMATPNHAYARPAKAVEKAFSHDFTLKLDMKARITLENGEHKTGSIYMELTQDPLVPSLQNLLRGEMQGYFYFKSDDGKEYRSLIGDDGETLLDQTHRSSDQNIYSVYGCNSTLTQCEAEHYEITFRGSEVTMNLDISSSVPVEVLDSAWIRDENGQLVQQEVWTKYGYNVNMIQVAKP